MTSRTLTVNVGPRAASFHRSRRTEYRFPHQRTFVGWCEQPAPGSTRKRHRPRSVVGGVIGNSSFERSRLSSSSLERMSNKGRQVDCPRAGGTGTESLRGPRALPAISQSSSSFTRVLPASRVSLLSRTVLRGNWHWQGL
jgi:hypothetical protein